MTKDPFSPSEMAQAPAPTGKAARVAKVIGYDVLRGVWISTMVLTPLFGFWLASSLAAYKNASQWLALLGGLALFPLLPVGWEAFAAWRRTKISETRGACATNSPHVAMRERYPDGGHDPWSRQRIRHMFCLGHQVARRARTRLTVPASDVTVRTWFHASHGVTKCDQVVPAPVAFGSTVIRASLCGTW